LGVAIPTEIRTDAEAALGEFCSRHSSAEVADRLRYTYEIVANAALLIEQKPSFMNPADWASKPVAKFRYSEARNVWSLYWGDSNDRWHRLSNVKPEKDIRKLLKTVIDDPLGVFWG
jgi:hypothetical protein